MKYKVMKNFLTEDECERLKAMALPRMHVSTVWRVSDGQQVVDEYRKSDQMFFRLQENDLVVSLEEKIADITGIPASHGEGIQVVRYGPGGYYRPHYDYFDPNYAGNQRALVDGGQRLKTFMVYLSNVEEGGETHFLRANISFRPEMGTAVVWDNVDERGKVDPDTFHAAEPVIRGEKWIFTKWLRERPRREALMRVQLHNRMEGRDQPT